MNTSIFQRISCVSFHSLSIISRRHFCVGHHKNAIPKSMSAWKINDYTGIDALELVNDVPVPPIYQPNDVLVEVKATSVNVLDVMMTGIVIQTINYT